MDWPYGNPLEAEFARGVFVGAGASCYIRGCVLDGAAGAGVEIAPRAARLVVESSTVTGCGCGSSVASGVASLPALPSSDNFDEWRRSANSPWQLAGECGAVEIELWTLMHPNVIYSPHQLSVEVVLRDCQIVGNLGPGASFRSLFDDFQLPILEASHHGDYEHAVHLSAARIHTDALAARFTIEGGSVCGNCRGAGVNTSPVGGGGAVVCNKSKRGKRHVSSRPDGSGNETEADEGGEEEWGTGFEDDDDYVLVD
jgi:hypothetical protein